jgi:hypothetical protein
MALLERAQRRLRQQLALRYRVDQQGSRHHHEEPLDPARFFDKQRRDKKQRVFEQAKAPFNPGLTFVGRHDGSIAQLAGVDIGAEHNTGLELLPVPNRLLSGPHVRLNLPLRVFERCVRRGTAFGGVAFVCDQVRGLQLVIQPALGQRCQRVLGRLGRREALGLQMKERLFDSGVVALRGFIDRGLGTLKGGLRRDHQPALGHPVVAEFHTLIASGLIKRVPRVPRQGLLDHVRYDADGVSKAGDEAEALEVGGVVLGVEFGVRNQIARTR